MKILCTSLWDNNWRHYWNKLLGSRGHEVDWAIGPPSMDRIEPDKYDAILCMWASLWSKMLSNQSLNCPLYVVIRSFEVMNDTSFSGIADVNWDNVEDAFMLNEAYAELTREHVPIPIKIFKNGIDPEAWQPDFKMNDPNRILWVANINHKKGTGILVQALSELKKVNKDIELRHAGKLQAKRLALYLKHIVPYIGIQFKAHGWVDRNKMRQLYANCGTLLSTSIVEGHPMNVLEGMTMGCKPLLHRYVGSQYQFPDEWLWTDFDELREKFNTKFEPERYRQFIIDNYDYKQTYLPIVEAIEEGA